MKALFKTLAVLAIIASFAGLTACKEKQRIKSLSELKRNETKNIANFITAKGFVVEKAKEGQTEFPQDKMWYIQNKVYLQVLDKGGEKAVPFKTRVAIRFKGHMFATKELEGFDNLSDPAYQSTEFRYIKQYQAGVGEIHYELLPPAPGISLDELMCEGLAFPLNYVGDGARVRLIVPFGLGPKRSYHKGQSMYVEEIRYTFIKD